MGKLNPCTGNSVTMTDVLFSKSLPSFCIARGTESPEEVALLSEGDEEEEEPEGEDGDFVDVDIISTSDHD